MGYKDLIETGVRRFKMRIEYQAHGILFWYITNRILLGMELVGQNG